MLNKELEIAVVTTRNNPFDLCKEMNISTDMVIASQNKTNSFYTKMYNDNLIKVLSTDTIGVGKNRNLAVELCSKKYIVFADDDNVYVDNYDQIILEEFKSKPDADIIIFSIDYEKNGEIIEKSVLKDKKLNKFNGLGFGIARIAAKRDSLLRANLHFSDLFGGGCIYSNGEDSIFLNDAFNAKLKIYSSSKIILKNIKDESSWFEGYNEKFFYDQGALTRCMFNNFSSYLFLIYFLIRFSKMSNISRSKMFSLMCLGSKNFNKNIDYKTFKLL